VSEPFELLVASPRGFADLLARELIALGAEEARERSTGVACRGDLRLVYRACLESRVANRVFLQIAQFDAGDADALYAAARGLDWGEHLDARGTLACDFTGRHPTFTHSQFGAVRLKDAIVDALRDATGVRPDIDRERPHVRVHAHAHGTRITLSLDLSGESLHRRGYRTAAGEAPLKENVAAGILLRAGWPELAAKGAEFLDPLCGSGTFVIEAAMLAADMAPGLSRDYYGFLRWRGHDAELWEELRAAAQARAAIGVRSTRSVLRGLDRDPAAMRQARDNSQRAGVASIVRFETAALADAAPFVNTPPLAGLGLLCTNPPYGVRLDDRDATRAVHRELGRVLRERFVGWRAAVLTGAPEMGLELGIRAQRTHTVWNGPLECRLLRLDIERDEFRTPGVRTRTVKIDQTLRNTPGARMFANRLKKNVDRLTAWAHREGVSCYRLYDADMPEYALAVDRYRSVERSEDWLYVQEYQAPREIEDEAVRRRRNEALAVLPEVTGVPAERIHFRTRRKHKRGEQYRKHGEEAKLHAVEEGGLRFWVNFTDYLDTGLFLDHRLTRARLRAAAEGRRFLNLFAYTGTATVYAAAGRARSTTSVDMSATYLDWAERNLTLNGLSGSEHELIRADARGWLADAARRNARFDLIFLDPPTFSTSKGMQGVLVVQRDHGALIDASMRILSPAGLLVFSTNAQRFRMDEALPRRYSIKDVSAATLPEDFRRTPRIHRCYEVRSVSDG
jgi:23S rRNA (guanine2445-N2)-methyltransferase / 23S rRNA (guanine2069-N7)-methyltransferase